MSDTTFQAPALEQIAALLPQYDFRKFIAQGGMGAVYLAVQRGLDREVAIKVLPKELGADADFHASFAAEAKAMARLNHPNLIGVYDFGDAGGMPYIVMEFVRGESLYHASFQTRVAPTQAVAIVRGICDGLDHAHAQGIIHRDIKPANVLLNLEAQPKIGDFGLARPAGKDESGIVMGTPGYAAPEVLNRPDLADKRSDLFAVGVILYELVTGLRAPFAQNPPPPASTICGCDIALDRICERAMNPVAALRYQSADEFSADLGSWLARQQKQVKSPAGPSAPGVPVTPRRQVVSAPRHTAYRHVSKSNSSPLPWLIAIAAIAAIAYFIWKSSSDKPEKTPANPSSTSALDDPHKKSMTERALEGRRKKTASSPFGSTSASDDSSPFGVASPDGTSASGAGIRLPDDAAGRTRVGEESLSGPAPAEVSELESKAKTLVGNLVSERDKALAANAKDFAWGLDTSLRSMSKNEQVQYGPTMESLKGRVSGNRVPSSAADLAMNERIAKTASDSAVKQKKIDEDFSAKAENIRSFYVERMNKLAETPDKKTAAFAMDRATAAADLDSWVTAMGFVIYKEGQPLGKKNSSSVFGDSVIDPTDR